MSDSLSKFASGSLSGLIISLALQPFDVIKTIQQGYSKGIPGFTSMKKEALNKGKEAHGIRFAISHIYTEDGIRGFWRGVGPAAIRVTLGLGAYFALLDPLLLISSQITSNQHSQNFMAGATSRVIAAALLLPVQVVKTRLEWGKTHSYQNTFQAIVEISRKESIRGLFSGLAPTVLRDAPASGLYVVIYKPLKQYFTEKYTSQDSSSSSCGGNDGTIFHAPYSFKINLLSGIIAGGVASIVTQPFDVVRTRLQLQQTMRNITSTNSGTGKIYYDGMFHTMKRMLKDEGFVSFYRGTSMRTTKRAFSAALTWTVYEEIISRILPPREII